MSLVLKLAAENNRRVHRHIRSEVLKIFAKHRHRDGFVEWDTGAKPEIEEFFLSVIKTAEGITNEGVLLEQLP